MSFTNVWHEVLKIGVCYSTTLHVRHEEIYAWRLVRISSCIAAKQQRQSLDPIQKDQSMKSIRTKGSARVYAAHCPTSRAWSMLHDNVDSQPSYITIHHARSCSSSDIQSRVAHHYHHLPLYHLCYCRARYTSQMRASAGIGDTAGDAVHAPAKDTQDWTRRIF